jgi:hypothetical protein
MEKEPASEGTAISSAKGDSTAQTTGAGIPLDDQYIARIEEELKKRK